MSDHVYKTVEVTGSSPDVISDAIRAAVDKAAQSLRNLEWFEVDPDPRHDRGRQSRLLPGHGQARLPPRVGRRPLRSRPLRTAGRSVAGSGGTPMRTVPRATSSSRSSAANPPRPPRQLGLVVRRPQPELAQPVAMRRRCAGSADGLAASSSRTRRPRRSSSTAPSRRGGPLRREQRLQAGGERLRPLRVQPPPQRAA